MAVNEFNSQEKIMRYTDKLDYFFNGGNTLIITELDLTNKCNNRCPNCSSAATNKDNAELSWEQIVDIADGLKKLDNKGVIISGGGEPLIHPRFTDALAQIRSSGMKIGVNSNGLALTEEKALAIAGNCEYFRISLDAGTPEMYKKTHGMEIHSFEKVVSNARLMSNIIEETGSEISFVAGFLTNKDTICDMEPFVALCKEAGIHVAQLRPFTGDSTDITKEYLALKSKYEDENFKVRASIQKYSEFSSSDIRSYDKCRGMFFSTCITADASIYACLHHRKIEKYKIGTIGEKSLVELWNSSAKWKVFESIDMSDCPFFCRNDSFNRTLHELSKGVVHSEFL